MNDTINIKGRYRLITAEPHRAEKAYDRILRFLAGGKPDTDKERQEFHAELTRLYALFNSIAGNRVTTFANVVPTVGRTAMAQRLAGTTTYTGIINYFALGTSVVAPTASDIKLGAEGYRAAPSSQAYAANVATLSVFIAAGTATGTWTEAGIFIDGTGSADTGQIFSHVALNPAAEKGATNSLTLECDLTIS